jgi:hypothetical protein
MSEFEFLVLRGSRSAYALHILNCRHEYGNNEDTMTLLKQIDKPSMLLPYEHMYIQNFIAIMNSSLNNDQMNTTPCLNSSKYVSMTYINPTTNQ